MNILRVFGIGSGRILAKPKQYACYAFGPGTIL